MSEAYDDRPDPERLRPGTLRAKEGR